MSAAVSAHGGTGPLSLMSCVRESSPPQDLGPEYETEKNVSSKKRFWNPRKWFKRKNNKVADEVTATNDILETKDTLRSRSTSELSEAEEAPRRRSGAPMHPGLSVSHDSVFHSPHSGSEIELEGAQSSSSLSIHQNLHPDRLHTELTERLRLRRGRGDTSEDDEGLPRSPCNSPTATDKTTIKDHPTKSHSTCSEGSLISMGSSEIDEDSSGQHSHHSSKLSLQDKKAGEEESELETVQSSSYPLNHSAAHHRVSVRPTRRHGAPRRKRGQQLAGTALPTTPEVNEESSIRSVTPDITSTREAVTELYSDKSMSKSSRALTENQLKCSSLPPGLAAPGSELTKLNRSRSNAGAKYQDEIGTLGEEDEDKESKKSDSFLGKLFPIRRSGKKKKSREEKSKDEKSKEEAKEVKEEKVVVSATSVCTKEETDSNVTRTVTVISHTEKKTEVNIPPRPLPRSGAAARQRVIPNDIPASPELSARSDDLIFPKSSPEKINLPSPLHLELENRLQQRFGPQSTSPIHKSPPISPKTRKSPFISPVRSPILSRSPPNIEKHFIKHSTKTVEYQEKKIESETRSKVIITGLSPFQKKALLNSEDRGDGYKSLSDLPKDNEISSKPVAKSHSFKSTQHTRVVPNRMTSTGPITDETLKESELVKASSLDSIKNLESSVINSKDETKSLETSDKTVIVNTATEIKNEFLDTGITISGPSHKAIVSVGNTVTNSMKSHNIANQEIEVKKDEISMKEQQISVTKIQVKRESTQVTVSKNAVPEFMNIQLHKVEKPASNIILSTGFALTKPEDQKKPKTPPIIDSQPPPILEENSKSEKTTEKIVDNLEPQITESVRKFSKEEIEIVEKDDQEEKKHISTALVTITSMTPSKTPKKPDNLSIRKSFIPSNTENLQEKPVLKTKSSSLDMVEAIKNEQYEKSKIEETAELKGKTHSVSDISEVANFDGPITLRRKSMAKQRHEDEPELMKVFARRSLKLKDNESEALSQQVLKMIEDERNEALKSRDSDKENQLESPLEERKKIKETPKVKEPLLETKLVDSSEVTLRKPVLNNKVSSYQRTASLNHPKSNESNDIKIQKQFSLIERPKTEWISNKSQGLEKKISDDDIISISDADEIIAKPKNFNQRKAEWEKRAQEALRKTTP